MLELDSIFGDREIFEEEVDGFEGDIHFDGDAMEFKEQDAMEFKEQEPLFEITEEQEPQIYK